VDDDRSAVYAAELAAFDGTDLETRQDFARIDELIGTLTTGSWWCGPTVDVRRARRDARSSTTRCDVAGPDPTIIRLADGQLTVATAAHELAHALAGVDRGHDATFRMAYLDVIEVLTNVDPLDRRRDLHVAQLMTAFEAAHLDLGARRWPAPPASVSGPIAL